MTRQEQLRIAKRAQRQREKANGTVKVELRLQSEAAQKLRTAMLAPNFPEVLESFLADEVVVLEATPMLRDIAWNRQDRFIPAEQAMALYERNWRFIEPANLLPTEAALIERLVARFGNGVLNV
jgi:hypothetical protein